MPRTVDVLIAGAGVVGMSTAFQIARRSGASVLVAEQGVGPGEGSTGASSAVCRFRYTHAEIVRLARDAIDAYRRWPAFLGLASPRAEYQHQGVLWLNEASPARAAAEARRLAAEGLRMAVIDDAQVAERFPAIEPCGLGPDMDEGEAHACRPGGPHLLELDGGYIDPVSVVQDLIEAARARQVEVRFQAAVRQVHVEAGRVVGATLADGERVACGTLVCAAGPWCGPLLAQVGLQDRWPLEPTRIQIVHIDRPPTVEGQVPVCIDGMAGIYFRTQNRGRQILVGSVLPQDEEERADPDDYARWVDDDFARRMLHALHHRVRGLSYAGAVRGYSGLYTINRRDMHPIVGPTPVEGFWVANGFSGHGFKLGPAIGALLARQLTGEATADFDTGLDPRFLAFDRPPIPLAAMSVLA